MAIFTAIGAAIFGAGTFGALATAAVLEVGVGIAVSLLGKSLSGQDDKTSPTGVKLSLQSGSDVPRSIIFGYGATAGSMVYSNEWGNVDGTPNAYLTQVICLSDYPVQSLQQVWVSGELVTLGGSPDAAKGYPVLQYRKDGVDHLWIKFYDGTQTAADTFLTGTVASASRPYGSTRVGTGCPYVIATSLVEDSLFSGFPSFKFALNGAALYDISKDSTAGGSGPQRFATQSTWGGDGDYLPAVQMYNVLRGITYGSQWLYGLQGLPVARLPASDWIDVVNKCRATIGGPSGDEPTYRSGGEVSVSVTIASAVEAMLTTCQGRMAEIGGAYKLHVGAPGDTVLSFADDEIISTQEQSFTPFFGLADTINGISATYPSPAQGWNPRVAPPLLRPDYETIDGARRLMADVSLDMVPYDGQVQRLMKSALQEARRARRHTFVLPPEAFVLEPNDVIEWTSVRNGYDAKQFRVDGISDRANLDVMVDITEVDPTDYDWDQEVDYTGVTDGSVIRVRPAPQPMTGWSAAPGTFYDATATARRPSIQVSYAGSLSDVRAVWVQVRLAGETDLAFTGEIPYDRAVASPSIVVNAVLIGNTDYEVRGKFVPFSQRDTHWSNQDTDGTEGAWLAVTTPNIPDATVTDISTGQLNQLLQDAIEFIIGTGDGSARGLEERILDELDRIAGGVTENTMASDRDRKAISSTVGVVQAAVVTESLTRATEDSALAQQILEVAAQAASGLAEGLFTVQAQVAPAGVIVRLAMLARVTTLDDYVDTGILIDLESDGGGGFVSKILLKADSIYFTDGDVATIPMVFEDGTLKLNVANIGTVTAGRLQNAANTTFLDLGTGALRIAIP